jgi:GrpB-like predicted nucleotidyltransferase (UPF0157 family)
MVMTRRVAVVPYDPAWQESYQRESERIVDALGAVVVAIHHIGSTAIPGIVAKPIVDMLLEVSDIGTLDRDTPRLERLGYEARGEFGIPGRRYFRRNDEGGCRTHHVHAFAAGSAEAQRHLAFRDFMVAHPEEASTYGALKAQLAAQYPNDMDGYMDGKDAYVKAQQARAVAWSAARKETAHE